LGKNITYIINNINISYYRAGFSGKEIYNNRLPI